MKQDPVAELRAREIRKYDRSYFNSEYWKEDLPGVTGNGGRSYDDSSHVTRFDIIGSAIKRHVDFESLLDVGCGPGLLLRSLASTTSRLAGVDASATALELALLAAPDGAGLSGRAEVVQAICNDLPFPDRSFDVVVCLDVLEHLVVFDVASAINEMVRVCQKFLICSINSDNPYRYHPTILSPETWRTMFALCPQLVHEQGLEQRLFEDVGKMRDEYSFYCYLVAPA